MFEHLVGFAQNTRRARKLQGREWGDRVARVVESPPSRHQAHYDLPHRHGAPRKPLEPPVRGRKDVPCARCGGSSPLREGTMARTVTPATTIRPAYKCTETAST